MHQTWKTPTPFAPQAIHTDKPDTHQLTPLPSLAIFCCPSISAMVYLQGQEAPFQSSWLASSSLQRSDSECSKDTSQRALDWPLHNKSHAITFYL